MVLPESPSTCRFVKITKIPGREVPPVVPNNLWNPSVGVPGPAPFGVKFEDYWAGGAQDDGIPSPRRLECQAAAEAAAQDLAERTMAQELF
jgi:hypothetical protein